MSASFVTGETPGMIFARETSLPVKMVSRLNRGESDNVKNVSPAFNRTVIPRFSPLNEYLLSANALGNRKSRIIRSPANRQCYNSARSLPNPSIGFILPSADLAQPRS